MENIYNEALWFFSIAFIFMFTVEKSYYYSCKWKRKGTKKKNPACCLRGLSCLALLSISFNIVNGIKNAVSQPKVRVRRAASQDIDQRVKIKPFLVPSSQQGSKNNCRRRLNWGDLTWTWSLTLSGSPPSDNNVSSSKICLLVSEISQSKAFYPAAVPAYIPETALVLVAGGRIPLRSSPFLLDKHREDIKMAGRRVSYFVLHWSIPNFTQNLTLTHCPCSHSQVQINNK